MDPGSNAAGGAHAPPPLVLPVLGIPVRFETDHPALGSAVEAAFGSWRGAGEVAGAHAREPRIRLRRARPAGPSDPGTPIEVTPRPAGRLMVRHAGGIAGRASLGRMAADVRVAADAVGDQRALAEVLDTLTLFLLTRLDRQPVHAAAIARGAGGLVLAGPSGSGKSTLAYAAMRAGLRVVTDDAVYVQLRPRPAAWGMARPIHLAPEAVEWFPELADAPVVARAGGKAKRRVPLRDAAGPPVLERTALCLLDPSGRAGSVRPLDVQEAVDALVADLDPGFDVFRETIPERIRALADAGAWRVPVGPRPHDALPTLLDLLEDAGA